MTLPTQLTLVRILLTFFLMGLLFVPGWPAKLAVVAGFLGAGATDWLDGYLARRWRQTSDLGALLDPIADKVLVLGLFLAFVQLRRVPAWMALIIVLRELVITGVRLFAAGRGVVLSAATEGKQKTVSQLVTIFLILAALLVDELSASQAWAAPLAPPLQLAVRGCLWITVTMTVVSGTAFFWRHSTALKDAVTKDHR